MATYEDVYKLTYVRGPSGIIVMLAEELQRANAVDPPAGARQNLAACGGHLSSRFSIRSATKRMTAATMPVRRTMR